MQTDYSVIPAPAFPGMLADLGPHMIESYVNGEASAAVAFGSPVKQKPGVGTDPEALKCIADTDEIVGVVSHSHAYAKGGLLPELDTVGVLPKAMLNTNRKGRVYVRVGATVAKGDRAYFQTTTQKWRASAVGGDTIDATKVASFRTAAAADGVAVLEFDFTIKP